MEIRSFKPYLILIGLMIVTALALAFTVDVKLSDQPGIRMELPPSLPGGWIGNPLRYSHNPDNPKQYLLSDLEVPDIDPETGEKLYTMSLPEYDALPHDTEFVKSIYTNAAADSVFVSIVLSGRERNSIHRPQRCLVGQGNTIVSTKYMNIPLAGRGPLKVAVLETVRNYRGQDGERKAYRGYYAYWFVGHRRETASHYTRMFWLAWDRVVHSVAHKWAYIAVAGERGDDPEVYRREITDFVQKLYPHLLLDSAEKETPTGA
ncbi:MAG: hypothetical protein PWQ29_1044 [Verrucomicrobiota bacterium]|nr:hypothetical protein [Verrucomicrobiota bacterium]